jgi:hypothetical protein
MVISSDTAKVPQRSVSVADLRKAMDAAFEYMQLAGVTQVSWSSDSYWMVSPNSRNDIGKEPELEVLNYSDDANDISLAARGKMAAFPAIWESMAVVLLELSRVHTVEREVGLV